MTDNPSFASLADRITEALEPLGLHISSEPMIAGGIKDGDQMPFDEDEFDFSDREDGVEFGELIDALKKDRAFVMIHATFSFNNLVWTDRILSPETYLTPELVAEMQEMMPSRSDFMKSEIASRLESGEELDDIISDLLNFEEETETEGDI